METRRYPVDTQTFSKVIEGNYVYVDKTALVYKMVKSFNYVFLSRPRRFGKSLLCSTLKEYFEGNKEMFAGLQMAELEKDWVKYPVIHLDFSDFKSDNIDDLKDVVNNSLRIIEEKYSVEQKASSFSARLQNIVFKANESYGQKAVIIIDEYDAPMLNTIDNDKLYNQICATIASLLAPLKQLDPYLRFVFITGTTTFPQMLFSLVLNNICNISLKPEYETICGISENELYTQLKDGIQDFADKNNLTFEQTLQMFKDKYGSYHFTRQMQDVFNPFSVISALSSKILNDYWLNSETPSLLPNLMNKFDFEMEDFENIECSESCFNQPVEQVADLVPFLFQIGYLTIKDYNKDYNTYILGYPNEEVRTAINFSSKDRNIESYEAEEERLNK
ncbi:MAG: AAA family ATPase [Bacteroidales bacterium]|nr:AAA family ATPase [Bacteroidales bacterium]